MKGSATMVMLLRRRGGVGMLRRREPALPGILAAGVVEPILMSEVGQPMQPGGDQGPATPGLAAWDRPGLTELAEPPLARGDVGPTVPGAPVGVDRPEPAMPVEPSPGFGTHRAQEPMPFVGGDLAPRYEPASSGQRSGFGATLGIIAVAALCAAGAVGVATWIKARGNSGSDESASVPLPVANPTEPAPTSTDPAGPAPITPPNPAEVQPSGPAPSASSPAPKPSSEAAAYLDGHRLASPSPQAGPSPNDDGDAHRAAA